MKNNAHKKRFSIDEFARHFYCKHARLNQIRADKQAAKKLDRNANKEEVREALEEISNEENSKK